MITRADIKLKIEDCESRFLKLVELADQSDKKNDTELSHEIFLARKELEEFKKTYDLLYKSDAMSEDEVYYHLESVLDNMIESATLCAYDEEVFEYLRPDYESFIKDKKRELATIKINGAKYYLV